MDNYKHLYKSELYLEAISKGFDQRITINRCNRRILINFLNSLENNRPSSDKEDNS